MDCGLTDAQTTSYQELNPPATVTALGTPLELYLRGRSQEALLKVAAQVTGVLGMLLAVAIVIGFRKTGAGETEGVKIGVHVLAAFFFLLGVAVIWLVSRERPRYAFVFFPQAVAMNRDAEWRVVNWADVTGYQPPSLGSLYPHLALRSGELVKLEHDFAIAGLFYGAVERHLARYRASGAPACTVAGERAFVEYQPHGAVAKPGSPTAMCLVGLLMVFGPVFLLKSQWRWVETAFAGPVKLTLDQLAQVKDPKTLPNPWITTTFGDYVDCGLKLTETRNGSSRDKARYLLVRLNDAWLITEVPFRFNGHTVTGHLDVWWSPLSKKIDASIRSAFTDRKILGFQYDCEYDYKGQCLAMLGVFLIFMIAGIPVFWTGWKALAED
jgi:hypothetical protein